jgi:hypothetical protein
MGRSWEQFLRDSTRECYQSGDFSKNGLFGTVAAIPAAVVEPLKVRMVTKGPVVIYTRALEIQKFLHSHLRRCPTFKYVGDVISTDDFERSF